jgi:hypothetical protein
MTRIPVNPELLNLAREFDGLDALALAGTLGAGATMSKEESRE